LCPPTVLFRAFPHRPEHCVRTARLSTAFPYGMYAVRDGEKVKCPGTGHPESHKARGPAEQMARKWAHGRAPRLVSQCIPETD